MGFVKWILTSTKAGKYIRMAKIIFEDIRNHLINFKSTLQIWCWCSGYDAAWAAGIASRGAGIPALALLLTSDSC